MKTSAPQDISKAQSHVDAATQRLRTLYAQGRYRESLDICLEIERTHFDLADPWMWIDTAANCIQLRRWQDAIRYAQTALAHNGNQLAIYDTLAHAHGQLEQWDQARRYGLQALNMRASQFSSEPVMALPEPGPMPPVPSAQTRQRNVIAFTLFGGDSKYCETAILNAQEQPSVYPYWVCRFYVDGSVPDGIIGRLRQAGAQIVQVDGPVAQWPGPVWRFLALDDPLAHRILLRDADSVISRREAGAVEQWITSGKRFHMMRDAGAHTELMMAGLWGVVAESLPPLAQLMQRFLSAPLESRHFADQFFLRQYIWPYARTSLLQHDSVFGFMGGVPFPDGARPPEGFCIGDAEGSFSFTLKEDQPDGSEVIWGLCRIDQDDRGQTRDELVCAYPATVKNGAVTAHIPARYLRWIEQGTARLGFLRAGSSG
jgi:hypothetical protein